MTDEELIERLGRCSCNIETSPCMAEDDCRLDMEAARRICALTEQLAAAKRDAKEAEAYAAELEKGRDVASIWNEAVDEALDILDDEGWLGESRERIELLKKPLGGKDE